MKQADKRFRRSFTAVVSVAVILLGLFYYLDNRPAEKEGKNISVVLYDAGNAAWESLLEGMKQAEATYPVNINYIILESQAGGSKQLEAIGKEIQNGAQGIILAAGDSEMSVMQLNEYAATIPIITVESGLSDGHFMNLSADNYEMGSWLARELKEDFKDQEVITIGLMKKEENRDSVRLRYQGFLEELDEKVKIQIIENPKDYAKVDAYAALHKKDLHHLTKELDSFGKRTPVYGIGNTPVTVAALEEGKITKLVFQNEFNMGYLSIEALYLRMKGETAEKVREIEAFLVSKEEVYSTKFERLLFPIIR